MNKNQYEEKKKLLKAERDGSIKYRYMELICEDNRGDLSAYEILEKETGYSWEYIRKIVTHQQKEKDK